MAKIQAIRGMNDILPTQVLTWQYLESAFRRVAARFAYQEIRFPIVEQTQLFKRSIGEVTDIVEKEMYSFDDRNGDNLSLRPEGTAVCVRAADQHGLLYNQHQRLWYHGPMFRHERPQKGRYRQFHQFGVEAFGMAGPDIDAEVISVSWALWQELDLLEHLRLEINNIGSSDNRKVYASALSAYLEANENELDEDAKRRMHTNPMRVLDSKNPQVQAVMNAAPKLADYVGEESCDHYSALKRLLDHLGISYIENPKLVRGLDYYNNCVFEWTTDILGAQSAVCGGGRYDGLVEQLGGKPTLAAGFAIGQERIVLMLDELAKVPISELKPVDIVVLSVGNGLEAISLQLASRLRRQFPQLGILQLCGGGKFNGQLKKAYATGADIAVIVEQAEEAKAEPEIVKIRRLDEQGLSETVEMARIDAKLADFLSNSE